MGYGFIQALKLGVIASAIATNTTGTVEGVKIVPKIERVAIAEIALTSRYTESSNNELRYYFYLDLNSGSKLEYLDIDNVKVVKDDKLRNCYIEGRFREDWSVYNEETDCAEGIDWETVKDYTIYVPKSLKLLDKN